MIYIGNFIHGTNQEQVLEEERRHGEFSLIVQADSAQKAVHIFRDRLLHFKETSSLFEGECSIFLIELLEFDQIPQHEAIMLGYKSIAGDPLMPYIKCSVPMDDNDSCSIHSWSNNSPEIDGIKEKLFLHFKE